jgi:ABC-2 type transport system permease protein
MSALSTLTRSQARIFLREPIAVGFGLVFPAVLLLVIGTVFPGATEANAAFGGRSLVDVYAPVTVVLGLATLAIAMLPAALGSDRERGILRRLSATPAHPGTLVAAHLVVQAAVVTCAGIATVLTGWLVLDLALPQQPGWFVVSFVLVVAALLSLGLLLGALVPTANAGQSLGMLVYFPLLFFAGVYIPLEIMPDAIQTIAGYTPAGAAVQALSASWAGSTPTATSLLVLAVSAAVAAGLATRTFRWE